MFRSVKSRRSIGLAIAIGMGLTLEGCGSQGSLQPIVTFTPSPPTATVEVGFHVDVTAVPTPPGPPPTPTVTPTPFRVPTGPYLELSPPSGPPVSRIVHVRAGHLPPNLTVSVGFSPGPRTAPLTTTAYTDHRGKLSASYNVPASAPGTYHMEILLDGAVLATATYRVISHALLTVAGSSGVQLSVSGEKFLPYSSLLLVAYPVTQPKRTVPLGRVRANRAGAFYVPLAVDRLPPGTYQLRAWSQGALAAQVAETFFQVVV